jgi:hypothetical protein
MTGENVPQNTLLLCRNCNDPDDNQMGVTGQTKTSEHTRTIISPMARPRPFGQCQVPACLDQHHAPEYCHRHYVDVIMKGLELIPCAHCGAVFAQRSAADVTVHMRCSLASKAPELVVP